MGEGMDFYQDQVVSHSSDRTGIRICPGRHLAFASLWINIASILATFEISRAADSAPDEVLGSEEQYTDAVVR
jgi:cytochrome P450